MAGVRAANRLARGAFTIMPASDVVNLSGLMDDAKCFTLVRQHRWPEGVRCPGRASSLVIRDERGGWENSDMSISGFSA